MSPRRSKRPRRAVTVLAAGTLMLVAVGLVGARTWFPAHVERATGRPYTGDLFCTDCHVGRPAPPVRGASSGSPYVSPAGIALDPAGATLFVAGAGNDTVLSVDLATGRVSGSVGFPGTPHAVAVSADGRRVAVTARHGDRVRLLDASSLETVAELDATEPLALALLADGERMLVTDGFTDAVVLTGFGSGQDEVRLVAGHQPYDVALSADERLAVVANRLVRPVRPGVLAASELTVIDPAAGRVLERRALRSAHLSEGVALSSDGRFAVATAVRFRNLLPLTQVARGAVMNSELVYAETAPGGRTVQFPLDEINAYFADPSDVVIAPDDARAYVTHAGARVVSVVDLRELRQIVSERDDAGLERLADDLGVAPRYVVARIPTADAPRALALSPDGRRLYVAEHLADSVAVIDTERLEVVERIDLGGPRELTTARRGARVFHDASVTFQGQFSCRSCHPDGEADALIWDFEIDGLGRNLVDTRSLLGIRDTAPFKWNGKNPDLSTQCGPRFARVLTRSDPFPPDRLRELVAYIESLPVPPPRLPAALDDARERGRDIFFRTHDKQGREIPTVQRCTTCHRPPLFTDRLQADVGTGGAFDTPHLFDVGSTAPYLHDGRALTLEEVWTVHGPDDTHGVTDELTKAELNDLVVYLRSL